MTTTTNGITTFFQYDSGDCFAEYAANGSLNVQYVRGSGMGGGIGSILYSQRGSKFEYFDYNGVGDTVLLTDPDCVASDDNLYDAYGNIVASSGSSANNRLAFTKERDFSIGLDNHGMRYYDPEIGRYISRDPAGYVDGLNVYLYVHNNPINHIDPLGLADTLVGKIIERLSPAYYMTQYNQAVASVANSVGSQVPVLQKMMAAVAFNANFNANAADTFNVANQVEAYSRRTSDRISTEEIKYGTSTGSAVGKALNQTALDVNPVGQVIQGVYGKSLEPMNPQEQIPASDRASLISGGIGGTAGLSSLGLLKFAPTPELTSQPVVYGSRGGTLDAAYVENYKYDMLNDNFEFDAPRGQIAGWVNPEGEYMIGEGHHRMQAAIETKNPANVQKLIENGKWDETEKFPVDPEPLPSKVDPKE